MINLALEFVSKTLDTWLVRNFSLDDSVVELGAVSRDNSSPRNRVLISLINLEHEHHRQYYGGKINLGDDQHSRVNPPEHFNIDLMFTANFEKYVESLKYLSAVIAFFQQNNTLSNQMFPEMPPVFDQFKVDIENLTYFQMHNLWNSMGASYQPSMVYKLRHISIDSGAIQEIGGNVQQVISRVAGAR